jgi:hypothetical protein
MEPPYSSHDWVRDANGNLVKRNRSDSPDQIPTMDDLNKEMRRDIRD